ncbi:hypothetical protein EV144_1011417 [Flavobacterium sp. 270]|uniref:hypothetical protein n=1 Tax=Flavobacterium sp. 270 TaxID=2512114 RepID=UPI001064E0F3|nr:hypothetical protein [Flavobacterium sp. 270]TDW52725.1 hypothetical protein EV144_1011417 [Flavobacterium sp. 270]
MNNYVIDFKLANFIFGIFSALGSLATFFAFLFLFRRDKDKEAHIELLEAQNQTMRNHNDLVAQQVEIFRNTSLLTGGNNDAFEQLRDIEEQKLKLSVRPNLWLNGAGYTGFTGELKIDLNNKGEDAKLIAFNLISNDIVLHNEHLPSDLDKGKSRYIFGRASTEKHIKDCEYEIDVVYLDKLKNQYTAKIIGTGNRVKIESDVLN